MWPKIVIRDFLCEIIPNDKIMIIIKQATATIIKRVNCCFEVCSPAPLFGGLITWVNGVTWSILDWDFVPNGFVTEHS